MKVLINRDAKKIEYKTDKETSVSQVMEREGYERLNPLDIENYNSIEWEGIEFNNLFVKDGFLYRFNEWLGLYPYRGLEIERIGTVN